MIYFDNNATTPVKKDVIDEITLQLQMYGNPSASYQLGLNVKARLDDARARFADVLGVSPEEIIFTGSGSEADNMAIKGAVAGYYGRKRTILTTKIEHHAVLNSVNSLKRLGYEIRYMKPNEHGVVTVDELQSVLDDLGSEDIFLVSVMHANNETGMIQPVNEMAEILRKRGILFHVDAVQSVGCMGLPDADLVGMSGHKVNGPKGVGALYVRKGTKIEPFVNGGKQEFGLRGGTENLPYIMGYTRAMEIFKTNREVYKEHTNHLINLIREGISEKIPDVIFNTADNLPRLPNTLNVSFKGLDGAGLVEYLSMVDICIGTGSACNTGSNKPSHVLTAQGLSEADAFSSVRISLGLQNTEREVKKFLTELEKSVKVLRRISGYLQD